MNNVQSMNDEYSEIGIELPVIIEVLSEKMYSSDTVFVRENVQNAVDAIRIFQGKNSSIKEDLRIEVRISTNYIEIEDWGVGMTREDLQNYYWTVGKSSKKTEEAKKAGCIGQFGIGGFANFGICSEIHVHTCISNKSQDATHSFVRKSDLNKNIKTVKYSKSDKLSHRGTLVRCIPLKTFDVDRVIAYLEAYIKHLPEKVYINGALLSGVPFQNSTNKLIQTKQYNTIFGSNSIAGEVCFYLDKISFHPTSACINGENFSLDGEVGICTTGNSSRKIVRELIGSLPNSEECILVYKNSFLIADFSYRKLLLNGKLDLPFIMPNATREGFDDKTNSLLRDTLNVISDILVKHITKESELLNRYIDLISHYIFKSSDIESISGLRVVLVDSNKISLRELREKSEIHKSSIYYTADGAIDNAKSLQRKGCFVVVTHHSESSLKSIIVDFLIKYCAAQEVPNVVVEEIIMDNNIPPNARFVLRKILGNLENQRCQDVAVIGCRLTPNETGVWLNSSEKRLYVDISHQDFKTLMQYTDNPAFESLITTFILEYTEDSLAQYRTKLFGKGSGLALVVNKNKYQIIIEKIYQLSLVKAINDTWKGPTDNIIKVKAKDFLKMEGLYLKLPEDLVESYQEYISSEHQIEVVALAKTIHLILYSDIDRYLILTIELDRPVFDPVDNDGKHIFSNSDFTNHILYYPKVNSTYVPIPEEFEESLDPKGGLERVIYIAGRTEGV